MSTHQLLDTLQSASENIAVMLVLSCQIVQNDANFSSKFTSSGRL